ncbi:EAL domain-containing protein [Reinekea sp.]|jgi:diguanylate cyclase (GGDEF)-like protein|uniref:EAL domain-containing protein n=1 Tax=Reinekea sp. TaxID=1970455 RepID=UPI00398939E4
MAISFRTRLISLFILLLGLTLFTSTWAVLRAVDNNARANAERELLVAERVFETLLEENSRQLTDRTALLAEDFGFRQAIATNEEETIVSALINHGERISADLILLMNPAGEVLIGTHDLADSLAVIAQKTQHQSVPFSELAIAEQLPFQLVMVPVKAPELVAWVGVGFEIDTALIYSFRDITKADVSLLYQGSANSNVNSLSTLNNANERINSNNPTFDESSTQFIASLQNDSWLNQQTELLQRGDQRISLVLSVSLKEAIAAYKNLQTQMLVIAAIVLLLAVLISAVIAGSITRPIGTLVRAARRIAQGDYQQQLSIPGKTEFNELGDTLNQMQMDIQDREKHITFQAQHDMLTQLPNRHYMAELMQERLQQPDGNSFAAVLIKVINFESLSDIYGVSIMDPVLLQAANKFSNHLEDTDTVGLIAADEFLIYRQVNSSQSLKAFTSEIKSLFAKPLVCNNIELTLDTRLGAVNCPDEASNYEDMLRRSRIALNEARLTNQCEFFYTSGLEDRYLRKLKVTQRLQHAISHNGFTLLFQPQFDLNKKVIHSAEALIRWHDTELGAVYPDEFIPLAENSGDITLITDWVFAEALAQLEKWHSLGYELGVSINLSAKDILKDNFIDRVIAQIAARNITPRLLMLEVTESALVEDIDHAIANLRRLYEAGVHLAMDDFGTGFSSLAQLKVLPVHELKIDKSFVLNLDKDIDDQKIVRSTIEMAHHLGLTTIAEGVENNQSISLLKSMNCDAIQGYYLSKPIASDELTNWLATFNSTPLEPIYA